MRLRCVPWGFLGLFAFTLRTACFSQCCGKIFDKSHRRNGLFDSYAVGIVHDSQREVAARSAGASAGASGLLALCLPIRKHGDEHWRSTPFFFLFIQTGDASP